MRQRQLPSPDLILYNGKIRSFDARGSIYEALACAGGRIVATGASDEIRRLAGADTKSVDLQGRTSIPGLTSICRKKARPRWSSWTAVIFTPMCLLSPIFWNGSATPHRRRRKDRGS